MLVTALNDTLIVKRADRAKLVQDILQAGRRLAAETNAWNGTSDDAYDRVRDSLDDPEALGAVLDELGIEGPMRAHIVASKEDVASVDLVLLRRAELAAIIATLGVVCIDIASDEPEKAL
jgi:hypothetical protein